MLLKSVKVTINAFGEAWPEFLVLTLAFPPALVGYFLAMSYFMGLTRKDKVTITLLTSGCTLTFIGLFFE